MINGFARGKFLSKVHKNNPGQKFTSNKMEQSVEQSVEQSLEQNVEQGTLAPH